MTLSIDYPNFQISSSFEIPESLRQLLYKAWQNNYEELYEEEADGTITLEETLLEILDALEDRDDSLCHSRYVCMALILALAVKPTVKAYLPDDQKIEQVFNLVINWFKDREVPTEEKINQLFPQKSVGTQAIDEALDVFKNLLQVLNPVKAKESLLEILDDCLEGYAIFPGSQGRRDLFNWWLLEVVPAAWCLQFSASIYTIKGIVPFNSKILPNKFLNIFDNYRNQKIVKANNNYQQEERALFVQLNINLDKVSFEQLAHYTALKFFLTVEDEPHFEATNLEKVNRYLESFHHLCKVEDWNRANQIINYPLDTFNQKQLHDQLGIWSYYQKQIDLYRQLLGKLNSFTDGSCLNNLGSAYYFLGDYFKAIDYYQQSLKINKKIGDRNNLSNSLMGLGNSYYSLQEYQKAIDYYQQSLNIAQEIGDRNNLSNSLMGLGSVYNSLGEYQTAIDYYQQSLKIAQEIGNRNSEASAIENLGKSLFKLEKYLESLKNLQASLEIFREIGNSANEAENLKLLGEVHQKLGNLNLAFEYCEQALVIATSLSIPLVKECQKFKEKLLNEQNEK